MIISLSPPIDTINVAAPRKVFNSDREINCREYFASKFDIKQLTGFDPIEYYNYYAAILQSTQPESAATKGSNDILAQISVNE